MSETHPNLLAGDVTVELPEDPAVGAIAERGKEHFLQVVAEHPASSLCWALLAETCLADDELGNSLAAYAYARTGYHRGLDQLRRNGWKGSGHVPWEHEPNRGFLRCLWALSVAAGRIGEDEERDRCAQFLRDSSETAYQVLSGQQAQDGEAEAPPGEGEGPAEDEEPTTENPAEESEETVQLPPDEGQH